MSVRLHQGDLPHLDNYGRAIAIDTETLGLNINRDRLCVVQLSPGDGTADVIQIEKGQTDAPNLLKLLQDPDITKIFHFARFDVAKIYQHFGVLLENIYCTKIASKIARTYTDRHGLKDLTRELLGVEMSKVQQSSDWGIAELSAAQKEYAASDVLYLHDIRRHLNVILEREDRLELVQNCFEFLPHRARLDLAGWQEVDIFAHS